MVPKQEANSLMASGYCLKNLKVVIAAGLTSSHPEQSS